MYYGPGVMNNYIIVHICTYYIGTAIIRVCGTRCVLDVSACFENRSGVVLARGINVLFNL